MRARAKTRIPSDARTRSNKHALGVSPVQGQSQERRPAPVIMRQHNDGIIFRDAECVWPTKPRCQTCKSVRVTSVVVIYLCRCRHSSPGLLAQSSVVSRHRAQLLDTWQSSIRDCKASSGQLPFQSVTEDLVVLFSLRQHSIDSVEALIVLLPRNLVRQRVTGQGLNRRTLLHTGEMRTCDPHRYKSHCRQATLHLNPSTS